jgi:FtsP/CotA-like multicopper oxidase with cupredoxin domain
VINILEFDPINNFHLHGNMFNYYPIGTQSEPSSFTDIVTLSQGDRGIIEFEYKYPGKYLFHAHKVEFSEKGWVGIFLVKDNQEKNIQEIKYGT